MVYPELIDCEAITFDDVSRNASTPLRNTYRCKKATERTRPRSLTW